MTNQSTTILPTKTEIKAIMDRLCEGQNDEIKMILDALEKFFTSAVASNSERVFKALNDSTLTSRLAAYNIFNCSQNYFKQAIEESGQDVFKIISNVRRGTIKFYALNSSKKYLVFDLSTIQEDASGRLSVMIKTYKFEEIDISKELAALNKKKAILIPALKLFNIPALGSINVRKYIKKFSLGASFTKGAITKQVKDVEKQIAFFEDLSNGFVDIMHLSNDTIRGYLEYLAFPCITSSKSMFHTLETNTTNILEKKSLI